MASLDEVPHTMPGDGGARYPMLTPDLPTRANVCKMV